VLIDAHAQKAALRLGVSADAVRAEFKKTRLPAEPRSQQDDPHDQSNDHAGIVASENAESFSAPPTPREMHLLKLLLSGGDYRVIAATRLDIQWLMNPAVKRVVQRCLEQPGEALPQGAAFLFEFQDDPEAQALIGTVLADHGSIPEPEKQTIDVLTNLRNDFIADELQRLRLELTHPDVSAERQMQLSKHQEELRALRQKAL
jgi:hypothetical protein